MASEQWMHMFESFHRGASTDAVIGHTEAVTPLYDKERFTFTGFRVVPKESPELAPRNERTGKWDAATGTIKWDDESTEQTAIVGPAVTEQERRNAKRTKNDASPETKRERLPEGERVKLAPRGRTYESFNPKTDYRRNTVLQLYAEKKSVQAIAKTVQMNRRNVKAILLDADVWNVGRLPNGQRLHNTTLTEADVLYIRASKAKRKVLADRFNVSMSTISQIRGGKTWTHIQGEPEPAPEQKQEHPEEKRQRRYRTSKFDPYTDPRRDEVLRLRKEERLSHVAIGKRLGMSSTTAGKILATVGMNNVLPGTRGQSRGEDNGQSKLTAQQAIEISRSTGKLKDVAAQYGISIAQVQRIRGGLLWSHVTGIKPRAHREAGD